MSNISLLFAFFWVILSSCAARSQEIRYDQSYIFVPKHIRDGKVRLDVKDKQNQKVVYSIVLNNIYLGHYRPYCFHNGHLYVIHRIGFVGGSVEANKHWSDELWRYDPNKKGIRIFSKGGLDYRVSDNENYIAINCGESLYITDSVGNLATGLSGREFGFREFGEVWFTDQYVFLADGPPGGSFGNTIIKMSLHDFQWSKFEVPDLGIDLDYSFNPLNESVVASDYPFFYVAEDGQEWRKASPTVTLFLYDCRSKRKSIIATSQSKKFEPTWIDTTHIEFMDPISSKRVIRAIKP